MYSVYSIIATFKLNLGFFNKFSEIIKKKFLPVYTKYIDQFCVTN